SARPRSRRPAVSVFSWPLPGKVSCVTAPVRQPIYCVAVMSGPRDLSRPELERCGLATIERNPRAGEHVTRIYCLRCGCQVWPERRAADPDGWWACARGCNTKYIAPAASQNDRPTP